MNFKEYKGNVLEIKVESTDELNGTWYLMAEDILGYGARNILTRDINKALISSDNFGGVLCCGKLESNIINCEISDTDMRVLYQDDIVSCKVIEVNRYVSTISGDVLFTILDACSIVRDILSRTQVGYNEHVSKILKLIEELESAII